MNDARVEALAARGLDMPKANTIQLDGPFGADPPESGRSRRFSPSRKGVDSSILASSSGEGRPKSRIIVTSRYWYLEVPFSQTG